MGSLKYFLFGVCALCVSATAETIHPAVKRGQAVIDPQALPLACIAIETVHASLPLDFMLLEELGTHKKYKAMLTKSIGRSDLLTAVSSSHSAVSLAILHLTPGSYRIRSLSFVGPWGRNIKTKDSPPFDVDVPDGLHFTVKAGCANYVGCLAIYARWPMFTLQLDLAQRDPAFRTSFAAEATAARDMKWAADIVPGMAQVPAETSLMEFEPAQKGRQ